MFLFVSQLTDILSAGFQNKFYNASMMDPGVGSTAGLDEYRINVSSDTPHWYIRDYLARTSSHYDISGIEVDGKILFIHLSIYYLERRFGFLFISSEGLANTCFNINCKIHCSTFKSVAKSASVSSPADLDECKASEGVCVQPALCTNTYGGYRCVCNGTEVYANQSCILGESLSLFYIHPSGAALSLQQCFKG